MLKIYKSCFVDGMAMGKDGPVINPHVGHLTKKLRLSADKLMLSLTLISLLFTIAQT